MARRKSTRESLRRYSQTGGYVVSHVNGHVHLVPQAFSVPGLMGRFFSAILASLSVAIVGGGTWFVLRMEGRGHGGPWWFPGLFPGILCLPFAAALAVASVRLWRSRNTPLVIDPAGRMSYGRREVLAAGTAKAVRIVSSFRHASDGVESSCEADETCTLYVEDARGCFHQLPQPYFSGLAGWDEGTRLSRLVGGALRVPVIPGPLPQNGPTSNGRSTGTTGPGNVFQVKPK